MHFWSELSNEGMHIWQKTEPEIHVYAQNESFSARHSHAHLQMQLAICPLHFGSLALIIAEGGKTKQKNAPNIKNPVEVEGAVSLALKQWD